VGHQRQELFHLASSNVPAVSQEETDLFTGIEEMSRADTLVRSV